MVLDAGHGGALHGAGVVQLPASLPIEVGMVGSSEDPGQKHLETFYYETFGIPWSRNYQEMLRLN